MNSLEFTGASDSIPAGMKETLNPMKESDDFNAKQIELYDAGCVCSVYTPVELLKDGSVVCRGCRKIGKRN